MLSCEQKSEKCKCRESYCQASKYESEDYLHVIFFDAVPETYSGIVVICDNDGFILEQVEFESGYKNGIGYEYRKDRSLRSFGTYSHNKKNNDWKLYDKDGYRTWERKKRNKEEIQQRIKEQRECED
jgi:antitoxin component YwqK of YwqJK toxin-antitoxin module